MTQDAYFLCRRSSDRIMILLRITICSLILLSGLFRAQTATSKISWSAARILPCDTPDGCPLTARFATDDPQGDTFLAKNVLWVFVRTITDIKTKSEVSWLFSPYISLLSLLPFSSLLIPVFPFFSPPSIPSISLLLPLDKQMRFLNSLDPWIRNLQRRRIFVVHVSATVTSLFLLIVALFCITEHAK